MRIHEIRRRPDVNQKTHMLDALRKYEGRDVYVSFTDDVGTLSHPMTDRERQSGLDSAVRHNIQGAKIGINPRLTYNTPVGIYAYPLDYVLREEGQVPFAGDRPYVWVLAPTGEMLDLSEYTNADLRRDIRMLSIGEDAAKRWAAHARIQTPAGRIWNILREEALLRARGVVSAQLSASRAEEMAFEDFLAGQWDGDPQDTDAAYDEFMQQWSPEHHESEYVEAVNKKASVIWNRLLRDLGYCGVTDPTGQGIIHDNEPFQAVFLTKDSVRELALIDNIKPREPMAPRAIYSRQPKALLAKIRNGASDDELIKIIDSDGYLVSRVGFKNLPPGVQAFIRDHAAAFLDSSVGTLDVNDLHLSDKQAIDAVSTAPWIATRFREYSPAVRHYIITNLRKFRSFFTDLALTDDEKLAALRADSGLYTWIDKDSPPPFLQSYMLDHHPADLVSRLWQYSITTETYVRVLRELVLRGPYKSDLRGFLEQILHRDEQESPPDFTTFLACFGVLPSRTAVKVVRDLMTSTLGRGLPAVLASHPALREQMIRLKPACAEVLSNDEDARP